MIPNHSATAARKPPRWLVVVLLGCGVIDGVLFWGDPVGDHALGNVLVLITSFIAFVCGAAWFSTSRGYPKWIRYGLLISMASMVAVALVTLRIERLSGTLVPQLVPRWAETHDRLLAQPSQSDVIANLEKTSVHDFPQFLGQERNQCVLGIKLARDWQQTSPRVIWCREIGAGWSGFVAVNGFAVTMEQRGELELTTCYQVETGNVVWWRGDKVRFSEARSSVGPRSTPTIHEGRVYTVGATGILSCLQGHDGEPLWQRNILKAVGTTAEQDARLVAWGRSSSPLIVGDKVIVPGGGPESGPYVSLLACDKRTGEIVWRGGEHQVSYSSPQLANLDGVLQILIVNEATVSGHDLSTGATLWETEWDGSSANNASASQVVPLSDNRLFLSKGYYEGAKVIRVLRGTAKDWTVVDLWHQNRLLKTKFTNICVREHFAYGLSDGILECVELIDGQRKWKRGRFGHGQILLVDDLLLVQSEKGKIALVAAKPDGFARLGEMKVLRGQAWNHLCLYNNYLLMRSDEEAACLELPVRD